MNVQHVNTAQIFQLVGQILIIMRFTDPFDVSFTSQENPMTVLFSFVKKLFGTVFFLNDIDNQKDNYPVGLTNRPAFFHNFCYFYVVLNIARNDGLVFPSMPWR